MQLQDLNVESVPQQLPPWEAPVLVEADVASTTLSNSGPGNDGFFVS